MGESPQTIPVISRGSGPKKNIIRCSAPLGSKACGTARHGREIALSQRPAQGYTRLCDAKPAIARLGRGISYLYKETSARLLRPDTRMPYFTLVDAPRGLRLRLPAEPGITLAQSLFLAGAFLGRPLCSGLGRCGLCQARFLQGAPAPLPEECKRLSVPAPGGRLAAYLPASPVPDSEVEVHLEPDPDGPSGGYFAGWCRYFGRVHRRDPARGARAGPGDHLPALAAELRPADPGPGQGPNPQMGGGHRRDGRLSLALHHGGAGRLRRGWCWRRWRASWTACPGRPRTSVWRETR